MINVLISQAHVFAIFATFALGGGILFAFPLGGGVENGKKLFYSF